MDWTVFYGAWTLIACAIAWGSRDHVIQKLSLVLLAAWALSNLAYAALGKASVPVCDPTIEALCAGLAAGIGYANRNRPALAVFVLYGAMLTIHAGFIIAHRPLSGAYIPMVNAVFMAQLLVVGGCGAWLAIRSRLHSSDQRPGYLRPRSARLAAKIQGWP